ncbi:MAG: hypothetical protein UW88_C0010G0032 [Candidatus Collierbacteria bacterium GW2011_GWD2_45_10]|uniref:Uncharacterized protein n=1 Tax=Candidatus Collierbacteria bacterium GW2011_GWB2_44_22 TaxID=1618387 RepID=A0A0G1HX87_9BACT|nr:MAG: hypothetical protein UW44_C0014G0015 [Candidatus Collierbacteria bacterium GW2011_GWB2_44_22]KKT65666.1 MAG: hypothetical protein UW58_C0023G0009 [Candidatus Collierbacteria bacterium GW2011_GWC2_44_30]KKT88556.1 MAG: hypothetical protein UW88_C0010G0032 [Candidatus Collierbacteria bacterium GW2011_GWD2_45_10]
MPPVGLKDLLLSKSEEMTFESMSKRCKMVTRLRTVAEEINPKMTELISVRFFCEEVEVIKIMTKEVRRAV